VTKVSEALILSIPTCSRAPLFTTSDPRSNQVN
jgi:hypothetical protein